MNDCPICSSDATEPAWNVGAYELARCRECAHLYVSRGFDASQLEQAYGKAYYAEGEDSSCGYRDYLADAAKRMRGFDELLNKVERYATERGTLLDYGCAVGLFVRVAKDRGWQAMGYERSDWAANVGRQQFGVDIVVGTSGAPPAGFDGLFDVVSMWDVLEHVEDPQRTLVSAANWLKPNGILALSTVNAESYGARHAREHWRHLAPPHHLHYFSRQSLRRALGSAGLQVVASEGRGLMFSADRRRTHLRGMRRRIEELVTHWRARPLAKALDLLDEVEVFAQRS